MYQEYSDFCWNLFNPKIKSSYTNSLIYLTSKLASEAIELYESYNKPKEFHSQFELVKELGDCCWYISVLHKVLHDNDPVWSPKFCEHENPIYNLVIQSGKLLGETQKFIYHEKDVCLKAFLKEVSDLVFPCINEISSTVEDVLEINMEKLSNRHGQSFNEKFYTSN